MSEGVFGDSYHREARLYPAALALLPLTVVSVLWSGASIDLGEGALALGGVAAVAYLVSGIVRSLGKRVEGELWDQWGGPPASRFLRLRDSTLEEDQKMRYRAILSAKISVSLPTRKEEEADAGEADRRYGSMVRWLQERCRGESGGLVVAENATYGFRRNMYGLKSIAVSVNVLVIAVTIVGGVGMMWGSGEYSLGQAALRWFSLLSPQRIMLLVIPAIASILWAAFVSKEWVREAADQYAKVLLARSEAYAEGGGS